MTERLTTEQQDRVREFDPLAVSTAKRLHKDLKRRGERAEVEDLVAEARLQLCELVRRWDTGKKFVLYTWNGMKNFRHKRLEPRRMDPSQKSSSRYEHLIPDERQEQLMSILADLGFEGEDALLVEEVVTYGVRGCLWSPDRKDDKRRWEKVLKPLLKERLRAAYGVELKQMGFDRPDQDETEETVDGTD